MKSPVSFVAVFVNKTQRLSPFRYRAIFEMSALELLAESRLPRTKELLDERRLCRLVSAGSLGLRPLARAKRFKMSVRETTPDRRPDMLAPGRAEANTVGVEARGVNDGVACGEVDVW